MNTLFRIKYYFNSFWKGYLIEGRQHLKALFAHSQRPAVKFVIFTGGRTGSTLLRTLLNSHPDITCEGELLKGRMLNPLRFIKSRSETCPSDVYGFKLLSYQLRDVQNTITDKQAFLKQLEEQGFKFIYLERRDKKRQAMSVAHAMLTDYWHDTGDDSHKKPRVVISEEQLSVLEAEIQKLTAFEKEVLTGIGHLHLTYESDLAEEQQRENTMRKIFKLLEVPYHATHSPNRKVLTRQGQLLREV